MEQEEAKKIGMELGNKIIAVLKDSLGQEVITPTVESQLRASVDKASDPEPEPDPSEKVVNFCEVTTLFLTDGGIENLSELASMSHGADDGQVQGMIVSSKTGTMTQGEFNAKDPIDGD